MITLVGLIKKMAKTYGTERADNILAGMLLAHKDYFKLKAEMVKIVQVTFAGNNEVRYDFFTDLYLEISDAVVCDTTRGYSIGRVVNFLETSTKARNWIVQRVDVEGHKARLEREKLARELEEMLG